MQEAVIYVQYGDRNTQMQQSWLCTPRRQDSAGGIAETCKHAQRRPETFIAIASIRAAD